MANNRYEYNPDEYNSTELDSEEEYLRKEQKRQADIKALQKAQLEKEQKRQADIKAFQKTQIELEQQRQANIKAFQKEQLEKIREQEDCLRNFQIRQEQESAERQNIANRNFMLAFNPEAYRQIELEEKRKRDADHQMELEEQRKREASEKERLQREKEKAEKAEAEKKRIEEDKTYRSKLLSHTMKECKSRAFEKYNIKEEKIDFFTLILLKSIGINDESITCKFALSDQEAEYQITINAPDKIFADKIQNMLNSKSFTFSYQQASNTVIIKISRVFFQELAFTSLLDDLLSKPGALSAYKKYNMGISLPSRNDLILCYQKLMDEKKIDFNIEKTSIMEVILMNMADVDTTRFNDNSVYKKFSPGVGYISQMIEMCFFIDLSEDDSKKMTTFLNNQFKSEFNQDVARRDKSFQKNFLIINLELLFNSKKFHDLFFQSYFKLKDSNSSVLKKMRRKQAVDTLQEIYKNEEKFYPNPNPTIAKWISSFKDLTEIINSDTCDQSLFESNFNKWLAENYSRKRGLLTENNYQSFSLTFYKKEKNSLIKKELQIVRESLEDKNNVLKIR